LGYLRVMIVSGHIHITWKESSKARWYGQAPCLRSLSAFPSVEVQLSSRSGMFCMVESWSFKKSGKPWALPNFTRITWCYGSKWWIPSGKRLYSELENHHFYSVNQLFLWVIFHSYVTNYQRLDPTQLVFLLGSSLFVQALGFPIDHSIAPVTKHSSGMILPKMKADLNRSRFRPDTNLPNPHLVGSMLVWRVSTYWCFQYVSVIPIAPPYISIMGLYTKPQKKPTHILTQGRCKLYQVRAHSKTLPVLVVILDGSKRSRKPYVSWLTR
jgi:hypothetical protein